MRNAWLALAIFLVAAGCSDQLEVMQRTCSGTWNLVSREYADGRRLTPPQIRGTIHWEPIDARKAHVSVTLIKDGQEGEREKLDHAASTYEISTSAITRKRHVLIQRGYRDREGAPFSHYTRGKTEKGKASLEDGRVKFFHAAQDVEEGRPLPPDTGFHQTFEGDRMTIRYTDEFTDTYQRVN